MTDIRSITIDDYDYPLPDDRIARHPLAVRDACRLLVSLPGLPPRDAVFGDLPSFMPPGALMVCNDTRVINARLRFRKGATGALVEIFCLEPREPADYERNFAAAGACSWVCLVGNSKRWGSQPLTLGVDTPKGRAVLEAARGEAVGQGSWVVRFTWDNPALTFSDIISAAGEIPIPPYLGRATEAADSDDYQTVYSRIQGSVAAPTAGLHFTPALLRRIADRGTDIRRITLHVGAGTFRPVKADNIGGHDMHSELCLVPRSLIETLAAPHGPLVAVGTTAVRTLESLYHAGCMMSRGLWRGSVDQWYPYDPAHPRLSVPDAMEQILRTMPPGDDTFVFSTRLLIAPGYDYRLVDAMVTNFHQPRSTLLLLVSAFVGDRWRPVYRHALESGYRFLSYGDACLFVRERKND